MGVGGINGERESRVWSWMAKRNCGNQGSLGGDERGLGGGRPEQYLRRTFQQIRERLESAGHCREKTPVKIDETQKPLKLFDVCRRRAVLNGGNVLGERGYTSLVHHVT
jgi:hypothetical protein